MVIGLEFRLQAVFGLLRMEFGLECLYFSIDSHFLRYDLTDGMKVRLSLLLQVPQMLLMICYPRFNGGFRLRDIGPAHFSDSSSVATSPG